MSHDKEYWPSSIGAAKLRRRKTMPHEHGHRLSSKAEGKSLGQAGGKAGPDKGKGKWQPQRKTDKTLIKPASTSLPKKPYFTVGSTESAGPFEGAKIIKLGSQKRQYEGEPGAVIGKEQGVPSGSRRTGGIKSEMGGRQRTRRTRR